MADRLNVVGVNLTVLTGELGAETLLVILRSVPLILLLLGSLLNESLRFKILPAAATGSDPLLLGAAATLTATMLRPPVVVRKLLLKLANEDDEGAIMTKVGPLPLFEAKSGLLLLVVEATTSGKVEELAIGGLGLDLNLLSRMESNSANCSMVLELMDLTMVCPTATLLSLEEDGAEGSGGGVGVAVVEVDEAGLAVKPRS